MDAKGQTKRVAKGAEEPAVKSTGEVQELVEQSTVETEVSAKKPLSEVLVQAEKAYIAYMGAERQVARIYKEHEQQLAGLRDS